MTQFLNTRKAVSEIEELIKNAGEKLILISPYLKLSKDFKELLTYRNNKDKVTTIIFREQTLKIEELSFLEELRFVKLLSNESLHAKCYLNDDKMIITSLNLYEFSMANNKEMGVLIDRVADKDLYDESYKEVDFIKETSVSFKYSTKLEFSPAAPIIEKKETSVNKDEPKAVTDIIPSNTKFHSATALSKELGISSNELTSKFEKLKWIEKIDGKSVLTNLGKNKGAQMKKGQYGDFIAWPETIIKEIM